MLAWLLWVGHHLLVLIWLLLAWMTWLLVQTWLVAKLHLLLKTQPQFPLPHLAALRDNAN
jgi:hypothetical protein